jgi:N-acetylated-alpha-linked acidic dipeptidase
LPIGYGDAQHFLQALSGHGMVASNIGKTWQGGLPFAYFTGPGGLAHLKLNMTFQIKPVWNVFGSIPAENQSKNEKQIIIGAHRDAWVYGGVDPVSGTTVLLEVARGLGFLYSLGWRPKRSILFASWDAEEYGVIGSTEWVEENLKELTQKTVAYLNVDTAVKGSVFSSKASPSLKKLLWEVTKDVYDPKTNHSIYELVIVFKNNI